MPGRAGLIIGLDTPGRVVGRQQVVDFLRPAGNGASMAAAEAYALAVYGDFLDNHSVRVHRGLFLVFMG